ncbi:MAG: AsmA family protein [Terracidiphilus sp.]|nr:AsmA family protein [Terracidiphilus sp.]
MADEVQGQLDERKKLRRKRVWTAVAVVAALIALLVIPPLVSLNHYQSRIAGLMASTLGRPVHLSEVSVRLLPRPAFVLSNLTVEEDPAFGVEPMLHADSVTATIRLLSLWRGKLELSRVSVDDASMNLVRTPEGQWNLEKLLGRAATETGVAGMGAEAAAKAKRFPLIRATNSRINIKHGAEKLPFSLTDTDLEFWQERPGEWRVELKGQPARTDLNLNAGDTGTVELKATVRSAREVRQMPVRLDLNWREAQLGQLTRLLLGRDPGWRGDLRGEMHVEGTADAAEVKARLRATGVHREEFTPASPLDFDANCGFVFHYTANAVEKLDCASPLGSGRVRITGELPGQGAAALTAELDKIPVAAGLDALRTVRSEVAPGLEAAGTISGKITYAKQAEELQTKPEAGGKAARAQKKAVEASPLTGGLTVEGFRLSGAGLSAPLTADKIQMDAAPGNPARLEGMASFPLGGAVPLGVSFRLGARSYQVSLHGQASVARSREIAHATGLKRAGALDDLAGDPLAVDVTASGPWMPADELSAAAGADDTVAGTVTVRNANWKAGYLVNHVEIAQATLQMDASGLRWDPVQFSYGPLKGTATLRLAAGCGDCAPEFTAQFGALDTSVLQAALLGAQTKGTLISELLDRLHPAERAVWPKLTGTVKADALTLGPVVLHKAAISFSMNAAGVEIGALDGELLGGKAHVRGSIQDGDKPIYTLTGMATKLSPAAVGQLLGERWTGGELNASGKVETAGYTGDDLADSAKGTLHLDWKHGSVSGAAGTVPAALVRFERWTADAEMGLGKLTLKQNEAVEGGRKGSAEGTVTLSVPAKASFAVEKNGTVKR